LRNLQVKREDRKLFVVAESGNMKRSEASFLFNKVGESSTYIILDIYLSKADVLNTEIN
jgi:hypothetical protein